MRVLIRLVASMSVAGAAVFGIGQAVGVGLAGAKVLTAAAPQRSGHLVFQSTVNLAALAAREGASAKAPGGNYPARKTFPLPAKSAPQPTIPAPNPPPTAILSQPGKATGFVGLTAPDNAAVNGFDLEPPDQGLCAHAGLVMEPVNLALRIYTEQGVIVTQTVPLSSFFGQPRSAFLSDPRCYYDAQTRRWFVTILAINLNTKRSADLIAVSQTSDPTGNYAVFAIDTTDNGTNGTTPEPNCPCFGDQPRIGADAHGFYISGDSFPIADVTGGLFNSNGGDLFAISKQGLAAAANGGPLPSLVAIHIGAVTIHGNPANAVQPAQTPQGASYPPDREYFLNTPDFTGFATSNSTGARAAVLWTLTGTSTLSSPSPSLSLTESILPSEAYVPPPFALQKPGPRPLGQADGAPLPPINTDDDRMQQVEYLNGQLFSSLSTGVGPNGNANRAGAAWFGVTPNSSGGGTVSRQGYVAAGDTTSLMYPAVGLDQTGRGVMTFSVSGPSNYPSAAYELFGPSPTAPIYITGPGAAPEDGFTCYPQEGFGPSCRWGDYSAASSDGTGNIVMGDEMIPNTARDQFANWGTFISTLAR